MDFANKSYSVIRTNSLSEDNGLIHYGVKGMKWGVRRDIAKRSKMGARIGLRASVYDRIASKLEEKEAYRKNLGLSPDKKRAQKITAYKHLYENYRKAQKKLYSDISEADINRGKKAVKRAMILSPILYGGLVGLSIEAYKDHKAQKYVATGKY